MSLNMMMQFWCHALTNNVVLLKAIYFFFFFAFSISFLSFLFSFLSFLFLFPLFTDLIGFNPDFDGIVDNPFDGYHDLHGCSATLLCLCLCILQYSTVVTLTRTVGKCMAGFLRSRSSHISKSAGHDQIWLLRRREKNIFDFDSNWPQSKRLTVKCKQLRDLTMVHFLKSNHG